MEKNNNKISPKSMIDIAKCYNEALYSKKTKKKNFRLHQVSLASISISLF